ncbi:MAG: cereblon family protein [Desulfovibrionales bacterium]
MLSLKEIFTGWCHNPLKPLSMFDDEGGTAVLERPDSDLGTGGVTLVCKQCGKKITQDGAKMSVNGSHEHVFFNPHGIIFELGCFGNASGCSHTGPPSNEFSWFAGHTWQVVQCGSCMSHLGWFFQGGEGGFYGLILPHLREHMEEPQA